MGDEPVDEREVVRIVRNGRPCESRMIERAMRPVRIMTVIIGPDGMLYTAFGGPPAEREPGDPSLAEDPDALRAAQAFWKLHALAGVCSECGGRGYIGRSEISGEACEGCDGTGIAPD
jgi:hypothetical protein